MENLIEEIGKAINKYSINFCDEKDMQDAIGNIFKLEKIPFYREVGLKGAGRIDFMVESIGIEIKVGHSYSDVIYQLHRYAQCAEISHLILVTTKMLHAMPAVMNDKPLSTINLAFSHSL